MIHFRFGALLVEHLLNKNARLKISDRYLGVPRIGYRCSVGHWMVILSGWYGWWIRIAFLGATSVCNYWTFFRRTIIEPCSFLYFFIRNWFVKQFINFFFSFKAIYQVILLNLGFVCLNCGGIKMFMLDSCSHVLKRSIWFSECFICSRTLFLHLVHYAVVTCKRS
jgi:hypothetical protein